MDWSQLTVDAVVVHYLPTTRDDPSATLLLTDAEIPLDAGLRDYFRDKIADRLEDKGLEVIDDPDVNSPAPSTIREIVDDPNQLVAGSKALATHLDNIQTGANSSGLLAVAIASTNTSKHVAIVKLERERGIRFAINSVGGQNVVDMELLRNLTLTDKTKVYKTALLTAADTQGNVEGHVADDQRARSAGVEVATFFLSRFLGCKPRMPAARLTFDFVQAANKMINSEVDSPEHKGQYQVALLAEMQNNVADIRPSTFARDHLRAQDREKFITQIEAAGLDPNQTFTKDTSLVKVSRFRMTFNSGMVLVGSKEDLEKRVDIPEDPGPEDPVQLGDSIDGILTGR